MSDQLRDRRRRPVFIHSSLDDIALSVEAFRVYCHLARRVNECNQAWPSYASIAETCFRGSYPNSPIDSLKRKAMEAVKELEAWNLIVVERGQTRTDGGTKSNVYYLTDEMEWNSSVNFSSRNIRSGTERSQSNKVPRLSTPPSDTGNTLPTDTGDSSLVTQVTLPLITDDTPPSNTGDTPPVSPMTPKVYPYELNPIEGSPVEEATATKISTAVVEVEVEQIDVTAQSQSHLMPQPFVERQGREKDSHKELKTYSLDYFSAEVDKEALQKIHCIAFNWRKQPWMLSATEFKPEMKDAVWRSNLEEYSVHGTQIPNETYIHNHLRKLRERLQNPRECIEAYRKLQYTHEDFVVVL